MATVKDFVADPTRAGQTVVENGYAFTYGPNGEAMQAIAQPDYNYDLSVDRASLGGSAFDQLHMTNSELKSIADARMAAQNGTGTWADANALAERIRSQYGYSGGADGSGYKALERTILPSNLTYRDPVSLINYGDEMGEKQKLLNYMNGNYGNDNTMFDLHNGTEGTGTTPGETAYNNFITAATQSGLLGQFTQDELDNAKVNPSYGMALLSLKQDYSNATTPEAKALAAQEAQRLRQVYSNYAQAANNYGTYAGYNPTTGQLISTGGTGSAGTVGLNDLQGMSYGKYRNGEEYKALMDAWTANGRRAMQDTLAQVSARTGGLASSYAGQVGQQTYGDYMGQAEDEAYSRYRDEVNDMFNLYTLAQQEEETAYQRALAAQEQALAAEESAQNAALEKAQLLASLGDYSGYAELYGIDEGTLSALSGTNNGTGVIDDGPTTGDEWDSGLYKKAINSISQNLYNNNTVTALEIANRIWGSLSDKQQTTLQNILATFGLKYSE